MEHSNGRGNQIGSAKLGTVITLSTIGIILIILISMVCIPLYGVWQQGLKGEAALAKAKQTRKILVEQAKAEEEAAEIRAKAIGIVGKAAQEYPEYRLQEFMGAFAEALQSDKIEKIIYVATEAGIPIMEASRLGNK